MTHNEKINYMRMAANLCKFGFENHHIDLLVSLYDSIVEHKGEVTVRDIVSIEVSCNDRKIQEELNLKNSKRSDDELLKKIDKKLRKAGIV